MKTLIYGLGNNGKIYFGSKHNIGKDFVLYYINKHKLKLNKNNFVLLTEEKNVFFAVTNNYHINDTYKNLEYLQINFFFEQIYLIFDDVDLELGRIKINPRLINSTHNGIKGIKTSSLDKKNITCLRIGVGRKEDLPLDQDVFLDISKKHQDIFPELEVIIEKITNE